MKAFAITLLAGPALMALLCLLGIPSGYYLGFTASCVLLPAVAIALGVLLARITETVTAMLAVVFAGLVGVGSAYGFRNVRELRTGEFARGVALAELPQRLDKDRLTLRDGVAREDLGESASEKVVLNDSAPSERTETFVYCRAYPIAPADWTRTAPVPIWRFGDPDGMDKPLAERVFHPGEPDELCQRAIRRAIAAHQLNAAGHPIYLEAMVSDSADEGDNQLEGAFATALCGGLWIAVVLYLGARDGLREFWRRRARAR